MTRFYVLIFLLLSVLKPLEAKILAGRAKKIITPPVGTPSAGFLTRFGKGIEDVAKELEALALYIDSDGKKVVFCSVDHLGVLDESFRRIVNRIKEYPNFQDVEIYISSSHTHSGGGGHVDLPILGWALAGSFDESLVGLLEDQLVSLIIGCKNDLVEVSMGVGYAQLEGLTRIRNDKTGKKLPPCGELGVVGLYTLDEKLFGVLFSFATHPYLMGTRNMKFSPDWIGYARDYISAARGENVHALYINGAQGDLACSRWMKFGEEMSEAYGNVVGQRVLEVSDRIEKKQVFTIDTMKYPYEVTPSPGNVPLVLSNPIQTELNLIVMDEKHAFPDHPRGIVFLS